MYFIVLLWAKLPELNVTMVMIFARLWVMIIARRGLKIKATGQGQGQGQG